MKNKIIIYQALVRLFGNANTNRAKNGTLGQNGCGKMSDFTEVALRSIQQLGCNYIWYTGLLQQASATDYSAYGIPTQNPQVLKGVAGSPYAISDYYSVSCDLADDPARRMEEFDELVARTHRVGLKMIIDFVPNHVARHYQSVTKPEGVKDLGEDDITGHRFNPQNNFYYCSEPLRLDNVIGSEQVLLGRQSYEEVPARATGNDVFNAWPGRNDWYETVKLNYGIDYVGGGRYNFDPIPDTWVKMRDILIYWTRKGVDGFRCDMAHMVPAPFWRWAIARARLRDEGVFFMAEGYNDHMKLTEGDVHDILLHAGFNAVYDSPSYDALRGLYERGGWANDLDACNHDSLKSYLRGVRYLENHDEQRLAAPSAWNGQGAAVTRALMAAQFAATACPVLVYNGQECGEDASGPGGFGGDNGRTSIFDYTSLPHFQHWTAGGKFDGSGMTERERALRGYTAALLPMLQHPALSKGGFYGLNWANQETPNFGRDAEDTASGHYLYAFLRHYRKAKSTVLVVCNLHPSQDFTTRIHIPENAREWCAKKPGSQSFRNLLDPAAQPLSATAEELDAAGLPVTVPAGTALFLEWA